MSESEDASEAKMAETEELIREDTTLCLQDLPPSILDAIFSNLTYSFVLQLRPLSSSIHKAVVHKFAVGYNSLLPKITKIMDSVRAEISNALLQLENDEKAKELINLHLRYSFLKVVHSEAKVLRAICQRYVEQGVWNYISAYGSYLLDHFNAMMMYISSRRTDDLSEPSMTSELLFLCSQQIEHFCQHVEPRLQYRVPFQVKVADIMDCAQDSSYSSTLAEWEGGYRLQTRYSITGMSSMDFPWEVFDDLEAEQKLETMLKSIKNNVRFTNFIKSVKEVWSLEDILDRRGFVGLKRHLTDARHFHRLPDGNEVGCTKIHHSREWRRLDSVRRISDVVYKNTSHVESYCIEVDLAIEGGIRPLELPQDRYTEGCGGFDLQMYFQYPSRVDLRVCKTCIRMTGKGEVYTFRSHNHHIER